ncbi:glycosyl hydrolase family 28-related protein [Chengkuizengella axinellae]|uniref:Glycosyl hydrolase family 28-related protein n=1 Tax=Chengkuizengella axinellae TaxID=3064388 RepID=A0ABT9IW24_9BACL|nr:glycosyl hydrolase family 28-related protein [Chengkuizengella sp. 2205SS18-9]MDP5273561.1 glycosyl hydrolase family 28-related protein [Chengkuizengella sp. 2205SS18-9]
MSTNKTEHLKLHNWEGTDKVSRQEFNENFSMIDQAVSEKAVNVKWFGALGDGSSDDTDALQNAVNFTLERGGNLYIPNGEFILTSQLNIIGALNITGNGINQTILKWGGSDDGVSNLINIVSPDGRIDDFKIVDLTVSGAPRHGFFLYDTHAWTFHNVKSERNGGDGFRSEYCWKGSYYSCQAYRNGENGFQSTNEGQTVEFISCWALSNTLAGIKPAQKSIIAGGTVENNGLAGLHITNSSVSVNGVYFEAEYSPPNENSYTYQVLIENTFSVSISGSNCLEKMDIGLGIFNSQDVFINGCGAKNRAEVYAWDDREQTGIWVGNRTGDNVGQPCENIVFAGCTPVPMLIEDYNSVIIVGDAVEDILGGEGFFNTEGEITGLASGIDGLSGTPDLELVDTIPYKMRGSRAQKVKVLAKYDGFYKYVNVKPNTSYTIAFWYYSEDAKVYIENAEGNRLGGSDLYPRTIRPFWRHYVFNFTTGENVENYYIRVRSRNETGTFYIADMILTEGAFRSTNFPINDVKVSSNNTKKEESSGVNVKDFGAKGNGVTDDTQAIQDAIDHAIGIKSTVFIPSGEYIITSQINIIQGVNITGSSIKHTILRWGGIEDGISDLLHIENPNGKINDFKLSHFTVEYAPRYGVYCYQTHAWIVECVRSRNNGSDGFFSEECWKGTFYSCQANYNSGNGFHGSLVNGQTVEYISCWAFQNVLAGIKPANRCVITGGTVEANGLADIHITQSYVDISGVYFEGATDQPDTATGPNTYHLLIENTHSIHVSASNCFGRVDIGTKVINSKGIVFNACGGGDESAGGKENTYAWDRTYQTGLWIDKDCENVVLNGCSSVPTIIEDFTNVIVASNEVTDLLNGSGFFNEEGDTLGLAKGLEPENGGGIMSLIETMPYRIRGQYVQQITAEESYQGFIKRFDVKPNTTYSIAFWYFSDDVQVYLDDPIQQRITDSDLYPRDNWRYYVFQFTVPETVIQDFVTFRTRDIGTFAIADLIIVEGAYDMTSFPLGNVTSLNEEEVIEDKTIKYLSNVDLLNGLGVFSQYNDSGIVSELEPRAGDPLLAGTPELIKSDEAVGEYLQRINSDGSYYHGLYIRYNFQPNTAYTFAIIVRGTTSFTIENSEGISMGKEVLTEEFLIFNYNFTTSDTPGDKLDFYNSREVGYYEIAGFKLVEGTYTLDDYDEVFHSDEIPKVSGVWESPIGTRYNITIDNTGNFVSTLLE